MWIQIYFLKEHSKNTRPIGGCSLCRSGNLQANKGPGPLYLSTRIKAHATTSIKFYHYCLCVSGTHATMYLCMSKDNSGRCLSNFYVGFLDETQFSRFVHLSSCQTEILQTRDVQAHHSATRVCVCVCVYTCLALATLDLALVDSASICLPLLPGC